MELWESICSLTHLRLGFDRVKRNHGKPGVDSVSVEEFERQIEYNLKVLADEIKQERYEPQPVLMVNMRQGNKERPIGISCVRDRVVQQALYLILNPLFEPDFLECSYAYRHGKNALMAVDEVQKQLLSGKCWVMETDITHFFDNINHSLLIARLRERIDDDRIIHLVLRCLKINVFAGMNIFDVELGVSQGSALSPLLGNIYLNQIDKEMSRHKFSYLRYSDDVLVLAESKEEAEFAFDAFKSALNKIGLEPKLEKTRVLHSREGFHFLGYHFDLYGKGPSVRAVEGLTERLRLLGEHCGNLPFTDRVSEAEAVMRGWEEYFGPAYTFEPEDLYSLYVLLTAAARRNQKERLEELSALRHRITGGDEMIRLHIAEFWLKNNNKVRAIEEAGQLLLEQPECEKAKDFLSRTLGLSPADAGTMTELILTALRENQEEDYMALAEAYAEKGFFDLAMEMQASALPEASGKLSDLLQIGEEGEDGNEHVPESGLEDFSEESLSGDQADKIMPTATAENQEALESKGEDLKLSKKGNDRTPGFDFTNEDLNLFIQLFSGREGVYAREKVDEEGRRSFISV